MNEETRFIPGRTVRAHYGDISNMTLWRWVQKGLLPPPTKINGRNYWREGVLAKVPTQGGDK